MSASQPLIGRRSMGVRPICPTRRRPTMRSPESSPRCRGKPRRPEQVTEVPLRCFGTSADVTGVVEFLVCDLSGSVTGECIRSRENRACHGHGQLSGRPESLGLCSSTRNMNR